MENTFTINKTVLKKFKSSKVFKDHKEEVNSLDISRCGNYLVSCSTDGKIHLYDLQQGDKINSYLIEDSKELGNIKFTNHSKTVLLSTYEKEAYSIIYLSLHDNVVLAKFLGENTRILSIDTSPLDSKFVTSTTNEEARVWDYNSTDLIAVFRECKATCIDNTGKVLACSHNPPVGEERHIYLYNIEEDEYEYPFSTLSINHHPNNFVIKFMKFSYNGKYLLCIDEIHSVFIVDAFDGGIINKLIEPSRQSTPTPVVADFSPCSKHIVFGMNNRVAFWNWVDNEETTLSGTHVKEINAIRCNPEYFCVVSACQNIILWSLDTTEVDDAPEK
ncbi:unnamed protein product [Moneuplotes crassus]|uniref:Uncharacterized protein n=1 Tax=Euplotes crassus TaxID=5936 RepID=A0AAD1XKX5_EUPCR|nr:unnamed protein product [Moneuplotes crassus]